MKKSEVVSMRITLGRRRKPDKQSLIDFVQKLDRDREVKAVGLKESGQAIRDGMSKEEKAIQVNSDLNALFGDD